MMKRIVLLSVGLLIGSLSFGQYEDIAPKMKGKKYRKKLNTTMDNLMETISFANDCDKNDLKYKVIETDKVGNGFYKFYNVPKTIIVKGCNDQTFTYVRIRDYSRVTAETTYHVVTWFDGKWVLNSTVSKK